MTKPMIRIHNSQTDEIVDREMTDEEYKVHLAEMSERVKIATEMAAKKATRDALLERLGLTEDEAKLLLG